MNAETGKYILDNLKKRSVKELSKELNIEEKAIRKFIEEARKKHQHTAHPAPHAPRTKKFTAIGAVLLIAILGLLVYSNSLNGKFIWDDEHLIKKNTDIKSWQNIPKIFTRNMATASAAETTDFYRPLQTVSYIIDYALWKLDVRGYHLTNIILHILMSLAVYWVIITLYGDRLLSLLASVLFLTHPIHTEVVSYISGRADSLAALFLLLAFILYIRNYSTGKLLAWLLVYMSYIAALFSRENSLMFPFTLLLYHYTFKKEIKPLRFIPIVIITALYILARLTVLKAFSPHVSMPATLIQRIPGFFVAITEYVRLLLWPFALHMEYGSRIFSIIDPKVFVGAIITLGSLFYAIRKRNANSIAFFSISWFFLMLLPHSNFYHINAYMAEHWLYLPSIGFFLIVAEGLSILYRTKTMQVFALVCICALPSFYVYRTLQQNTYWAEPVSFYERTLAYAPQSARVYYNLGNEYKDIGRHEKSVAAYRKAVEIRPDYAEAYNNLGAAQGDLKKDEESVLFLKKAIALRPNYADAYYNLGVIYKNKGQYEDAIASYKKALELDPQYVDAYNNLGVVYGILGKNEEALSFFKKTLEMEPRSADAYNNIGMIYNASGKQEVAVQFFKKAIEINPHYMTAYNNLGTTYLALGKNKEAISCFETVLRLAPGYIEAYYRLAVGYYNEKQYSQALAYYKKAKDLGYPVDPEFLTRLKASGQ